MAPTETKQWTLKSRPKDLPTYTGPNANFVLETKPLPALTDDQVLLKALFFSNDPAQRAWLDDVKSLYVPPVPLGEPMRIARGIYEVVESRSSSFKAGDKVSAGAGWREYAVVNAKECMAAPEPPKGLSYSHYLGALGGTGLTAYYGLTVVGEAKRGDTLVVSGAAGATGSMVVQIAKGIVGCSKVIGLAGSDEKCRWVEGLGADQCINYKAKDWKEQLAKACGDGVDLYFDNVAGETLDEMLPLVKDHGVIIACGGISGYNDDNPTVLKNYMCTVFKRLSIRGFIVTDYIMQGKAQAALDLFTKSVEEGKLKIDAESEQVVETKFEDVPKTWLMLFQGGNRGKLVTKLV